LFSWRYGQQNDVPFRLHVARDGTQTSIQQVLQRFIGLNRPRNRVVMCQNEPFRQRDAERTLCAAIT
jgi:hypothetical protein